jgi:hypothetical protein
VLDQTGATESEKDPMRFRPILTRGQESGSSGFRKAEARAC